MSLTLAFRGVATGRRHSRSRCTVDTLAPRNRRWHVHLPRSARTDADSIEGASADYCDDFVCKSSPAVEQTVRAISKDLKRANSWSPRFQPDVKYSDGMRKFRGAEVMMKRNFWVKENVTDYKVVIKSMKMLSKGKAEIRWQLRGSIGLFEIDVLFTTTITMNLLSGRLTEMSDSWNLENCSPPGRAAFLASRSAWAAQQASADAAEGIQSSLDSLSSWDEDDSPRYSEDPTDPTKFFQGGGADRNADLFLGAAVIGVLWVFALAYIELSKL